MHVFTEAVAAAKVVGVVELAEQLVCVQQRAEDVLCGPVEVGRLFLVAAGQFGVGVDLGLGQLGASPFPGSGRRRALIAGCRLGGVGLGAVLTDGSFWHGTVSCGESGAK